MADAEEPAPAGAPPPGFASPSEAAGSSTVAGREEDGGSPDPPGLADRSPGTDPACPPACAWPASPRSGCPFSSWFWGRYLSLETSVSWNCLYLLYSRLMPVESPPTAT